MHFLDHTPENREVNRSLRLLLFDGICSQILGVFTTGAILVAFALHMGASNVVIGLIAAIPPFAQILQIPAIYLVNLGKRRRVVVAMLVLGRLVWIVPAAAPFFVPPPYRIPLLLACMLVFFGCNSIAGCAWNSWMRDLIPERVMGAYFARRFAIATGVGALLSIFAGVGVDLYGDTFGSPLGAYSILFLLAGLAGMVGTVFLMQTKEPAMERVSGVSMITALREPFHDANYRKLLVFLGWWSIAVNIAAPFFTVYMLKLLGLSMAWVLGLSVLSQLVNVVFYQLWGGISDRFSNKSVLSVSGTLFILTFLIWPFTTFPEPHSLTIPLLVIIHALAGVSTAGVTLCAGNIALKAAPYGRATAYLAVNALISGLAATFAPILAGLAADWFDLQQLRFDFTWISDGEVHREYVLHALNLGSYDFLFVIAFVVGLYAMHRLLAVREEGEVKEEVVLQELYSEVRRIARHASNVAGLRHLTYFPYSLVRYVSRASESGRDTPRD